MALYPRECLDCIELQGGDDKVECLWIRIRGKDNQLHILVGACWRVAIRIRRQMKIL